MDSRYQQESMDESMGGVEDNMSTTPTGGYNNGYQSTPQGQPMQSSHYQHGQAPFSPTPDSDPNSRSGSHGYQQPMQPYSRPSSGLSGAGDRYGQAQAYQEQNQRPSQQGNNQGQTQSSVVIKVGMVGDAQIGKTSLMVKYVEGSWDEDYIQTLGMKLGFSNSAICAQVIQVSISWRRQSQYATPKSPSQSGILAARENLSICFLSSVMMPLRFFSCSTSRERAP